MESLEIFVFACLLKKRVGDERVFILAFKKFCENFSI